MYEVIVNLIGPIPEEFTFIYSILTLVLSMLVIVFLFQLFFLPIKLLER